MKIKVCGLKYPDNIEAVAALKPDYMGFICYKLSPRFIDDLSADVLNSLSLSISKTAVFVNETQERIDSLITQYGFNAIQLHGNESPEFCRAFKNRVTVLKAFGIDDDFDFERLAAYKDSVDYFLFDTKTVAHGGSGKVFNWDVISKYDMDIPFFLSGGLDIDNLEKINEIKHPAFYGVDLNSRFETMPGMKDINRLEKAFKLLR